MPFKALMASWTTARDASVALWAARSEALRSCVDPEAVGHFGAKPDTRAVDPLAHDLGGDAEDLSRLLRRETVDLAQEQGGALALVEHCKSAQRTLGEPLAVQGLVGPIIREAALALRATIGALG